jgi:RNA polymerase sigma factor (sigma-70 family)
VGTALDVFLCPLVTLRARRANQTSMSTPMTSEHPPRATNLLADPSIRRTLEEFVRRRVPGSEVDDVVQTVLCDALAAPGRPEDAAELKRWLLGIARHKVADHHRRSARESAAELPELAVAPPPVEARELLRWAEEQAAQSRDAKQTLAWMAREGEGEKLESIAAEERVPATRVRQRVSRMRRWMRERWLAELAAVAMLGMVAILLVRLLRQPKDLPEIAPRPEPWSPAPLDDAPLDRARVLRADALRACGDSAFQRCLDQLDEAARLDPAGDVVLDVAAARDRARKAIERQPATGPAPSASDPVPTGKKLAPPPPVDTTETKTAPAPDPKGTAQVEPLPTSKATAQAEPLPTLTKLPAPSSTGVTPRATKPPMEGYHAPKPKVPAKGTAKAEPLPASKAEPWPQMGKK